VRLPRFEYVEPKTLPEALAFLSNHEDSLLKAGGTDLLPRLKLKLFTPKHVINLKGLSVLNFIRRDDQGNLLIGALTPLSNIETSSLVREHFGALADAVARIGSREIRNMGTLGGNLCLDTRCQYYNQSPLFRKGAEPCIKVGGTRCFISQRGNQCHALFCADTVPLLMASDASLTIVSPKGERSLPLEDFYTGNGKVPFILSQDEIVAEVKLPQQIEGVRVFYLKHRFRDAIDFPVAGIAVRAVQKGNSKFEDIRIVAGGVTSRPVRCLGAEEELRQGERSSEFPERAGELAAREVPIVSGSFCSIPQRRIIVKELVAQAVRLLLN
jgi:4-hydroxybenzoyl-CoA reductase subunit beta